MLSHPPNPRKSLWTCVSRQLVAPACPQRRGQPALLSLVDARLSRVVSPPPRAHPALSSLQDASGLDAGLLSRSDGTWRHRHLWDRVDPPHARRPQPPADRPQRPLESPLDCRRETVSLIELSLSRLNHWLPGREAHPEI